MKRKFQDNSDSKDINEKSLDPSILKIKFDQWDSHRIHFKYFTSEFNFFRLDDFNTENAPYIREYLKSRGITDLLIYQANINLKMVMDVFSECLINKLTLEKSRLENGTIPFLLSLQPSLAHLHLDTCRIPDKATFYSRVTSLSLESCNIGLKEMKLLLGNKFLNELHVTGNYLGDEEVKMLSFHPTVKILKLSVRLLLIDSIDVFLENRILESLDLSGYLPGNQALVSLLRHPNLTELHLSGGGIGPKIPVGGLAANKTLKVLNLNVNELDNEWVKWLSIYCPHLTSINFLLNKSIIELAGFFKFPYLRILELCWGGIVFPAKVDSLPEQSKIIELNFHGSKISIQDIHYLSKMPFLKKLCLNSNISLGDEEAKVLSNFSALTDLSLGSCNISDQGAAWLAKNSQLQILNLFNNPILDWGIIALALNPMIRKLSVSFDHIKKEVYKLFFLGNQALSQLITKNFFLRMDDYLFERNPELRQQYHNEVDKSLLLYLPKVLADTVHAYIPGCPYRYRLFYDRLTPDWKSQWHEALPQIEEKLPEIKDIISLGAS